MSMDRSFDPVSDEAIAAIVARSKQDNARYEALRQRRFAEAKAARLAGLLSRCERASPASCCSNPPLPRGNLPPDSDMEPAIEGGAVLSTPASSTRCDASRPSCVSLAIVPWAAPRN